MVFANGGVQEALVNEAFLSLFIIFRTLKRPQSLGLRIVYQSPMMRPSSSSKFGGRQPHDFLNSNYLFPSFYSIVCS